MTVLGQSSADPGPRVRFGTRRRSSRPADGCGLSSDVRPAAAATKAKLRGHKKKQKNEGFVTRIKSGNEYIKKNERELHWNGGSRLITSLYIILPNNIIRSPLFNDWVTVLKFLYILKYVVLSVVSHDRTIAYCQLWNTILIRLLPCVNIPKYLWVLIYARWVFWVSNIL